MSSSLFYDCYAPYETYPGTEYVEGDVKFCELKEGDKLYYLNEDNNLKEMVVTRSWYTHSGYCYIKVKDSYFKTINFGPSNCENVIDDSFNNSIVYYDDCVIGTNKESVIKTERRNIEKHLNKLEKEVAQLKDVLGKLDQYFS